MTARLILVSNRLPVTAEIRDQEIVLEQSGGGLATGLKGTRARESSVWIGWPGEVPAGPRLRTELIDQLEGQGLVPVFLTRAELKGFYEDYSNSAVWPIFHDLQDQLPLEISGWEMYVEINRRFAEAVADVAREGDVIWVNDYHLMLAPSEIRKLVPKARIGFFLHIPFPHEDMFRVLPQRKELIEGLLGADLVGFHTRRYANHFLSAVTAILGERVQGTTVRRRGRSVRVGAFPMGIDVPTWEDRARSTPVAKQVLSLIQDAGRRKIMLGIDRLDYTKGVRHRMAALERLLQRDPGFAERVRFIQVVFPSRERIESYAGLRRQIIEMAGRINATYGSARSQPVHLLMRSFSEEEVSALYSAADIMLVTPLRDGMNLVAKEFVASRLHDDGVLVLSEFAGAADEMPEALIINPYDVEGMANALKKAIDMTAAEQRARMVPLRANVRQNDVHAWSAKFLSELGGDVLEFDAVK